MRWKTKSHKRVLLNTTIQLTEVERSANWCEWTAGMKKERVTEYKRQIESGTMRDQDLIDTKEE